MHGTAELPESEGEGAGRGVVICEVTEVLLQEMNSNAGPTLTLT